jgi:WD40 repeat protein
MEIDEVALGRPAPAGHAADNPYVGPKPLQSCDKLYGRDCEVRDLCDLLIAERLVLLYSPSGAGKSSLINAGLVELLRSGEHFRVLPTLRVNLHSPGQRGDKENRYVRSVKECLLTGLTDEQRAAMAINTLPSLSDFLGQRPHCIKDGPPDSKYEVLIFDQFEEICTLDPTDRERKEQFFSELREALRSRNRWALFVIREDYLAEVDSFSHLLPTALSTRFRLNLLTIDQAREAISRPAAAAGKPFPPEQVDLLAADLATVTLQCGEVLQHTVGEHVEPVQLQVVCRRLWQRHVDGVSMLTDMRASGAVDAALESFYADAVKAAAGRSGSSERQLRTWIEAHLVVKPAMRNQIMRTPEQTLGLPDESVQALVGEHLLRFDRRSGREWIEITHDRMIAPVLASNERWRSGHLQPFQQQAELWAARERGTNMLLSKLRYDEAEAWRQEHPGEVSAIEIDYLTESKHELERAEDLARTNHEIRRQRRLIFRGAVVICLGLVLTTMYFRLQEKISYIDKLNGQALALPQGQYELTLRYALSAYDVWNSLRWFKGFSPRDSARLLRNTQSALLAGLVAVPPAQTRLAGDAGHAASVRQLAFHPRRRLLASASADSSVLLWDLEHPASPIMRFKQLGHAYTVAFNAAGDLLALGGASGNVAVWRLPPPGGKTALRPTLVHSVNYPAAVGAVAFDGDAVLAAALWNGEVSVRALDHPQQAAARFRPAGQGGAISSMVFLRGGKLAFGDANGAVWIWPWQEPGGGDVAPGRTEQLAFSRDESPAPGGQRQSAVQALAYDAERDRLAVSGWTRQKADAPRRTLVEIWDDASVRPRLPAGQRLAGGEANAHALAFSRDGNVLVYSGAESRSLSIADVSLPADARAEGALPAPLRFQERLFSAAFSPREQQGRLLAVGGGAAISLLDLGRAGPLPTRDLALAARLGGMAPPAYHAAMSADGRTVVMGAGSDLSLHMGAGQPLTSYPQDKVVPTAFKQLGALDVAADGGLIAVGGSADEPVRVLDRAGRIVHTLSRQLCPQAKLQSPHDDYRLAFSPARGVSQLALASGSALCVVDVRGAARRVGGSDSGRAPIRALAYSADGTQLAILEGDSTVRLQQPRAEFASYPAPALRLTTIAFTSDPRYLAAGTTDPDIWILDLVSGKWSRLDPLHESDITSLHFAVNDGTEMMVSSDLDGRVMLWEKYEVRKDVFSYRRLGRALTQKGPPAPVALSQRGDLLLVGGATPRMFDLRMKNLVDMACRTLPDNKYKACRKEAP